MINIDIKPLSVNEAWQGKRFKTERYKSYEKEVLYKLKNIILPDPPLKLELIFFVSSMLADIDNPIKPFVDILQKKYKFNDRDIYCLVVNKCIVKRGEEKIMFQISKLGYNDIS